MLRLEHVAAAVTTIALPQVLVTLVVLAGATWLAIVGKIDAAAVVGLYTLVLGYVFGRSAAVANNGT